MAKASLFSLAVVALAAPAVHAGLIASWDFNDNNLAVDQGLGSMTTSFSNTSFVAGTTANALPGVAAGSALSLQSNANNGRNLTFSFPTSGFEDVVVTLAWRRNNMGFNSNQVAYSLDGTTFTSFQSSTPPTSSFGVQTLDFSAIASLENQPQVFVRITFNGAGNNGGNNHLDNINVVGNLVPAPGAAVLALGALLALRRRR